MSTHTRGDEIEAFSSRALVTKQPGSEHTAGGGDGVHPTSERCYVPAGTVRVEHGETCDCRRTTDPMDRLASALVWGVGIPASAVLVLAFLQAAVRGAW